MTDRRIKKVLIVGGGTAGWMTAAALAGVLDPATTELTLVESASIATVGVGEATIPPILNFNNMLALDEADFIRRTKATYKLGIEFVNWGVQGNRYLHPFDSFGVDYNALPFHNYWLRGRELGFASNMERYSIAAVAARSGRFGHPSRDPASPYASYSYAFHFDAGLYAEYLREHAEKRGARRIEGTISTTHLHSDNGFIKSVQLQDGRTLEADLFIDCSGFSAVLFEKALKVDYIDWSHWLPCDAAVTVASDALPAAKPFTRATAHGAGWQWRIPLQHRTGNGHVFCRSFCSDDEAVATLLQNTSTAAQGEPRLLRFNTGRRKTFWEKNCVAIGLASGFLEPLESTSIHLIQSGISKLIGMFPTLDMDAATIDFYNRQSIDEIESIRDFIILHYVATNREDTPFWRECRAQAIPESLRQKLDLYRGSARVYRRMEELFSEAGWFAVMNGQGVTPKNYHPLAANLKDQELQQMLAFLESNIAAAVQAMPTHMSYLGKIIKP